MVDAPEKIWAVFGNHGLLAFRDDRPHSVEYTRSDLVAELEAENERRILSALEPAAPEPIAKGLLSDDEAKAAGLGKFGHHPDPAIDFEIEVESLHARLIDAKGGISKPGTDPETVVAVLEDIERAMTFRVGGDPSAVAAKQVLRGLEADARQATQPAAPEPRVWRLPTIDKTLAEMLAVATGGEDDEGAHDEWLSEQRASVDLWQASIRDALTAAPEGQQPVGVVWFGYDENTGEFTGESCSVEPHDSHRFRAYAPVATRHSEQAVTEAMSRIRDYADKPHADRYVIRNMAEDALKAAMEAGRHD